MKKIIFLMMFISTPAFADWSSADTKREAAYLVFLGLDLKQTRYIVRNTQDKCPIITHSDQPLCSDIVYYERNPILGKTPSIGRVNNYFLLSALVHVGVVNLFSSKWRAPFQYVSIGWQVGVVAHNYSMGIKVEL